MEIDLSKYIRKKTQIELDENNNIEDFSNNPLITTRNIKEYFDGSNIFVTGSTGFLGKVLIEKLLRSCDGIGKIYILLRPKRGVCSETRFEDFKKNNVFDRIREKSPQVLEKLVCVPGDIKEPLIGLNESDAKLLQERIDIVFHVAASVKFNEPLRDAANLNTFGTQRVMELCTKMSNLKSLVHVSTAYSNPYLHNVGEQVYGSTSNDDHQMFMNGVGVLPDEFVDTMADRFQKKHPNFYTLTKQVAEQLVASYSGKLPISIVRPSIVTVANVEPCPGWIDNIYGITGIIMEMSRGTLTSVQTVGECKVDLVPVDLVCNTIITAAWANSFKSSGSLPVYNCTSGQFKPLSWQELKEKILKFARMFPTKYIVMYPQIRYTTSVTVHRVLEALLHFFPAIVLDVLLRIQKKKPFMFKLAKRFRSAVDTGTYFALNEWNFETGNVRRLIRAAQETQLDAHEFNCDMSSLDWDDYIKKYILGIRTFILKDDLSSLPSARRKLKKIIWTKRIVQLLLLFAIYYVLFYRFWN